MMLNKGQKIEIYTVDIFADDQTPYLKDTGYFQKFLFQHDSVYEMSQTSHLVAYVSVDGFIKTSIVEMVKLVVGFKGDYGEK